MQHNEYDLAEAFQRIENELMASMIRNMDRHRAEETAEGYNWSMWQAEQLKALERQNAIAEGKLISREEAVRDLSEFCTILKMSLQSLGQDLGNKVAPHVDVVTARRLAGEIRGTIEAALGELSVGGVYPPPEE